MMVSGNFYPGGGEWAIGGGEGMAIHRLTWQRPTSKTTIYFRGKNYTEIHRLSWYQMVFRSFNENKTGLK